MNYNAHHNPVIQSQIYDNYHSKHFLERWWTCNYAIIQWHFIQQRTCFICSPAAITYHILPALDPW